MSFAKQVLAFNENLDLTIKLSPKIRVLNPYVDNPEVVNIAKLFYDKYYNDNNKRKLILGINPGRLGAGATGIPFTDPKCLREKCNIETDIKLHEPSSVFVYEVIDAYGDVREFYKNFYISSVCPLGFVVQDSKGRLKNYNYYDSADLVEKVTPFIIDSIKKQLAFGIDTKKVFCLGAGKNHKFLKELNKTHKFFDKVIPLEHPRYVMQYKSKSKQHYIDKYLQELKNPI